MCSFSGRANCKNRVTSELVRSTSVEMNPAISRATSFSAVSVLFSISADALMVPSGLRSSCARPAVSCPSAASLSERRTASCASITCRLASARCSAVRRCFSLCTRSASASTFARLPTMNRHTSRWMRISICGCSTTTFSQSRKSRKDRYAAGGQRREDQRSHQAGNGRRRNHRQQQQQPEVALDPARIGDQQVHQHQFQQDPRHPAARGTQAPESSAPAPAPVPGPPAEPLRRRPESRWWRPAR